MNPPSLLQGRLLIVAAAILWSLSGAFIRLLTTPNDLGLGDPPVRSVVIAFYRTFFAGVILALFLRRADITYRPLMIPMALSFALMNWLFIKAMAEGPAANAIILQYTAPLWLVVAGVLWLGEKPDRRSLIALAIAMAGVAVIVHHAVKDPKPETLQVVFIALGSGVAFAGVIFFLRLLRDSPARWLTVLNLLAASAALLYEVVKFPTPTLRQLAFLALFGVVQMGIPYWLMSRGLKAVNSQEASTITLLEPLFVPVWTYLVASEVPETATFYGGSLILAALLVKFFPLRREACERARIAN